VPYHIIRGDKEDRMTFPSVLRSAAAFAFATLLALPAAPALAADTGLGTLTVKGRTTALKYVVATRETDPEDPDRTWLVLLATDRPVAPADRSPGRLRALAAEDKLRGVRILWAEGFDRVEAVPYHADLAVSGMRGPERPTLDLTRLDEKRVEAEFRSKMMGQDWHFHARLAAAVGKGGVFEPEPEATVASRASEVGASPQIAKKLELGKLGYEYTEEMFFHAVAEGDVPAVKLFLDLGMSANSKDEAAGHVLVAAAMFCSREPKEPRGEVIDLLLAAGANPKAADENNSSALLWASESCPVGVVKALIKAGADVNARAKGSATPLMMAEVFKREDVVKVLEAAGAKK
jgi:hypothetical protein